jgi:hypothetical protein
MARKYFVATRPQTNRYHAIHREGCPFLPENENRIYLGNLSSVHEAIGAGLKHFRSSTCCLFCLKEHYTERMQPEPAEVTEHGINSENSMFQLPGQRVMFFLN